MLESKRLIFRKVEDDDFDVIAKMMRDEGVRRIWGHYFSDDDVRAWIERRKKGYQDHGIDYLLAIQKETGEVVGQIGILRENIEGKDVWGIGYILNGDARGCGYATEGAKAMAEYAFETMGVEKLICDIRPMNTESIAVAKRIGMKETGSFVKIYHGEEMPHLVFELDREDQ